MRGAGLDRTSREEEGETFSLEAHLEIQESLMTRVQHEDMQEVGEKRVSKGQVGTCWFLKRKMQRAATVRGSEMVSRRRRPGRPASRSALTLRPPTAGLLLECEYIRMMRLQVTKNQTRMA